MKLKLSSAPLTSNSTGVKILQFGDVKINQFMMHGLQDLIKYNENYRLSSCYDTCNIHQ